MSLSVMVVPVTAYQQNCSIVKDEATGKIAVVDPGGDIERIEAAIQQLGGTVEKILLTHGHMDHWRQLMCCASSGVFRSKGLKRAIASGSRAAQMV